MAVAVRAPQRMDVTVTQDMIDVSAATVAAWVKDLKAPRVSGAARARQEYMPYGVRNETGMRVLVTPVGRRSAAQATAGLGAEPLEHEQSQRFAMHDWREVSAMVGRAVAPNAPSDHKSAEADEVGTASGVETHRRSRRRPKSA